MYENEYAGFAHPVTPGYMDAAREDHAAFVQSLDDVVGILETNRFKTHAETVREAIRRLK